MSDICWYTSGPPWSPVAEDSGGETNYILSLKTEAALYEWAGHSTSEDVLMDFSETREHVHSHTYPDGLGSGVTEAGVFNPFDQVKDTIQCRRRISWRQNCYMLSHFSHKRCCSSSHRMFLLWSRSHFWQQSPQCPHLRPPLKNMLSSLSSLGPMQSRVTLTCCLLTVVWAAGGRKVWKRRFSLLFLRAEQRAIHFVFLQQIL